MKSIRKVLLALLAISIVACGFSVFAFAAENTAATEILEFYESKVFVNETFTDAEDLDSAFEGADESFTADTFEASSVTDGVLTVRNQGVKHMTLPLPAGAASGFGVNAGFAFNDADGIDGLSIILHSDSRFNNNIDLPLPLFVKGSDVKVADCSEVEYSEGIIEDIYSNVAGVENGQFYTVCVYVQTTDAGICGSVVLTAADGTELSSTEFSVKNYAPVEITLSFMADSASGAGASVNSVQLDFLEIYQGSFARRLNDNKEAIGEKLIAIAATDDDAALRAASKVVSTYGYNTDGLDAAVAEPIDEAIAVITEKLAATFAEEFIALVGTIDATADYTARYSKVVDGTFYSNTFESLQLKYPDVWAELNADNAISDALESFYGERDTVKALENATLTVISVVDTIRNPETATYETLENAVTLIGDKVICPTYRADGYDEARVTSAQTKAALVVSVFETVSAKAETFVDSVYVAYHNILSAEEGADFATGYAAFVVAKANYVSDVTCPVDTEKYATFAAVVDDYDAVLRKVTLVENEYMNFKAQVDRAIENDSFRVKDVAVAEASAYLDTIERGYPGVTETIQAYNEICEYIETERAKAVAFIKAVVDIDFATDLNSRKEAIKLAKSLQDSSYSTFDAEQDRNKYQGVTVSEAVVKLSQLDTVITHAETIIKNFIDSVEAINSANTANERRAAIINALANEKIAETVDPTNNPDLAATQAASRAIDQAILDYNESVTAANAASEEALEVGCTVAAATVPTAAIKPIVAIVKKIFD